MTTFFSKKMLFYKIRQKLKDTFYLRKKVRKPIKYISPGQNAVIFLLFSNSSVSGIIVKITVLLIF